MIHVFQDNSTFHRMIEESQNAGLNNKKANEIEF